MTIRFACGCGKKMKTSDDKIGRKVLCSSCGSPVVVPSSDSVAVETVAAPVAADTAGALLRGSTAPAPQKPVRRNLAFDDPRDHAGSNYDATETVKYVAASFLLPGAGVFALCFIIFMLASWATRSDSNHPPLAEVSGVITLDGQPLQGARIIFRPRSGDEKDVQISSAVGRTDSLGRYRLQYTRDVYGAPLGISSVQITASDDKMREIVPRQYRDRSHTEAVMDQDNEINFELRSGDR